jgi:hypothetical protein
LPFRIFAPVVKQHELAFLSFSFFVGKSDKSFQGKSFLLTLQIFLWKIEKDSFFCCCFWVEVFLFGAGVSIWIEFGKA